MFSFKLLITCLLGAHGAGSSVDLIGPDYNTRLEWSENCRKAYEALKHGNEEERELYFILKDFAKKTTKKRLSFDCSPFVDDVKKEMNFYNNEMKGEN